MTKVLYLTVGGTHENRERDSWTRHDSDLSRFLEGQGLVNIAGSAVLPYDWSDDLDMGGGHYDWVAGGRSLFYYIVPPLSPRDAWSPNEVVLVTHSHARQVVLYAASMGLKIDRWLDIAGPVRKDMDKVHDKARPNIRRHMHLHAGARDFMQWMGELFDGHVGIVREDKRADVNDKMPKGHGNVLREVELFPTWVERGWVDFLKGEAR